MIIFVKFKNILGTTDVLSTLFVSFKRIQYTIPKKSSLWFKF